MQIRARMLRVQLELCSGFIPTSCRLCQAASFATARESPAHRPDSTNEGTKVKDS